MSVAVYNKKCTTVAKLRGAGMTGVG